MPDAVASRALRKAAIEQPADLEERDRAALLELWVRAWTAAWPSIDFEARRAWLSSHLDSLLAGGAVLLLARTGDGGRATGFLTIHPDTGEVDQLAVDPDAAGRGIGRALLDAAKRLGPGCLRLIVNHGNRRALTLYERAGFAVMGEGVNPRSGLPVCFMEWRAPP